MVNSSYMKTPGGILKIVEIVFVVIAISILRATGDKLYIDFKVDVLFFGIGITVASLIVTPLLLICYLMGKMEIQQTVLEISLNFIFAVFLVVFGSIGMNYYTNTVFLADAQSRKDCGITMSFFCLAASLAYLVDTIVAAMNFVPR